MTGHRDRPACPTCGCSGSHIDDVRSRFAARVAIDQESGCWLWTGSLDRQGYAYLHFGGHKRRAARLSYELHLGPIPSGLTIDHLCRRVGCVNPAHLEAVTNVENVRRAWAARGGVRYQRTTATTTHCRNGHPRDGNGVPKRDRDGSLRYSCRECARLRSREYRAVRKLAATSQT